MPFVLTCSPGSWTSEWTPRRSRRCGEYKSVTTRTFVPFQPPAFSDGFYSQSSTITLWLACRREAICRHLALLAALSTRERNAMMTRLTVCCPQRNERLRTLPRCLRQVQQCSRQTYDCVIQVQICNGVVHVQAPPLANGQSSTPARSARGGQRP